MKSRKRAERAERRQGGRIASRVADLVDVATCSGTTSLHEYFKCGGRTSSHWEVCVCVCEREIKRETERQRDRERQREKERQRQTDRLRQTDRDRQTDRKRERDRERDRSVCACVHVHVHFCASLSIVRVHAYVSVLLSSVVRVSIPTLRHTQLRHVGVDVMWVNPTHPRVVIQRLQHVTVQILFLFLRCCGCLHAGWRGR